MGGYWDWTPATWDKPVAFGGVLFQEGFTPSWTTAGGGGVVNLHGGGVLHFSPAHVNKPLADGMTALTIDTAAMREISDNRLIKALPGRAQKTWVRVWVQDEFCDQWEIGTTARTQWTMTHSFGYATTAALSPAIAYVAPTVRIENDDGTVDQAMTVVTSGPPTGFEVQVDDTADDDYVTTADLTAKAGKLLTIYYQPLLYCQVAPWSSTRAAGNDLRHQVDLLVIGPNKDWAADTP